MSTCETVAAGNFCLMTAHAPATCGVAIDVPLAPTKPPPGVDEVIELPGASSLRNGATFVNDDMTSDFVVDPTLMAVEMQPGDDIAFGKPSLPDATTVAIPTERNWSIAALVDPLFASHTDSLVNDPPPRLMFTDAMLKLLRSA